MRRRKKLYLLLIMILGAIAIVSLCHVNTTLTNDVDVPVVSDLEISDSIVEDILDENYELQEIKWQDILEKDAEVITDDEYGMLATIFLCEKDKNVLERLLVATLDREERGLAIFKKTEYYPTEKFYKLVKAEEVLLQEMLKCYEENGTFEKETDERFALAIQYYVLLKEVKETVFVSNSDEHVIEIIENEDNTKSLKYENKATGNEQCITVTQVRRGDSVISIVQKEVERYADKEEDATLIADMWRLTKYFDLLYVGVDVNDDISLHKNYIFKTDGTSEQIDKFHNYMNSEEGQDLARKISYEAFLGERELSYELISEDIPEIIGLLNTIHEIETVSGIDYYKQIMNR